MNLTNLRSHPSRTAVPFRASQRQATMDADELKQVLTALRAGDTTVDEALERLRHLPFRDLEFAKVDHHRSLRCGFPEVIFCPGKRPSDIAAIAAEIVAGGADLLATRATPADFDAVAESVPEAEWHERASCITVRRPRPESEPEPDAGEPGVAIVCAGTSDLPVAEEARVTVEMARVKASVFRDVGVAGLHRLIGHLPEMRDAAAIVVVAGMEGALPSVVGGLVDKPVIAVPTSVGYGASFDGVAALLGMLNSCASGVSVVNIDNGFGAGYIASLIAKGVGAARKGA